MPMLRQAEAAECGLACAVMVAGFYGHQTDLATLRREYPISLKGATLKDVVEIAAQLKLGARAVRCEVEELRELRLPAILHWNMSHFVVLKKVKREGVVINDPARGQIFIPIEEIGQHFTGVALELAPASGFQKRLNASSSS